MENQDADYGEFMSAFEDTPDYQTDGADESVQTENDTETGEAPDEATPGSESGDEEPTQDNPQSQHPEGEETFILKVNKEERPYSREEVISLAQKGADYDRVKEQLAQSRQSVTELQTTLDGQQEAMELLGELAKDAGVELPALLENLRMGLFKKQGLSEDAARERLARLKVEKENAALRASATPEKPADAPDDAKRVREELTQFRSQYPDVPLTQELLDKLMPGVASGKTLADAYHSYEASQKDARIAELERLLAAEKQNKENRAASPGSQKDSGGRRNKDEFDDFMRAFE